ncbi:MAG: hypothetical protein EBS20_08880 [Actinobacteria bacterium]|nr:hypothetical protein [Actinomycetota bacterium]
MAGNTNYDEVSSSATTVTFGAKALTITGVTANNKVYDGTALATLDFSSASLVGVVPGDSSSEVDIDSSSVTGEFASSAVGTDVAVTVTGVALTGTNASSYLLTQPTGLTADILSASRTLSFSTTSYSTTYGDAPFTVSASPSVGTGTVTYSASGSACTVNSSTGLVTITGAGTCSISASVATDGVYDSASTTTPATVTVGKAPLTVTAGDQSVTYQSAASTVTNAGSVTYSGFVNSETASVVTGSVTYTTTYTASTDAGTSGVVVTPVVSGLSATNYSLTAVSGTVTVTKASQSVSFGVLSAKTYGDAAFTVTATAVTSGADNGNLVSFASGSPEVCSVAGDAATVDDATSAVVTLLAAGTCEITASQAGTTNHTAATDVTREFTVAKRAQADVVLTNADTFVWGDDITLAATGGSGTGAV